jgi:TPR repeat protein
LIINNSDSIIVLGYFNYVGIKTIKDHEIVFSLFSNASEENYILTQYLIGQCYKFGHGIAKGERLAIEYYVKITNKDYNLKL